MRHWLSVAGIYRISNSMFTEGVFKACLCHRPTVPQGQRVACFLHLVSTAPAHEDLSTQLWVDGLAALWTCGLEGQNTAGTCCPMDGCLQATVEIGGPQRKGGYSGTKQTAQAEQGPWP